MQQTKVYLVGAGPGTIDLLTLKGARVLREANVIIYDALVDASMHTLFAPEAELIYVGKRAGQHALSQPEINEIIIQKAQEGHKTIVRLKGGDPFIFGRGGEEMQRLHDAGIAYEIVPGVTAGIAAPAYMGIPVTHRHLSRSVTLITAYTHEEGLPNLDWEAYAHLSGTLVFYMGMKMIPFIAEALIGGGLAPETDIAIISRGTRPGQLLIRGKLSELTQEAHDYEALTPGLLVVGDVTSFADTYTWFTPPSLKGQRVLITRSQGQSSSLEEHIKRLDGESLVLPSISIQHSLLSQEDYTQLLNHKQYPILAFTSPNGVRYTLEQLQDKGLTDAVFSNRIIASVGPATTEALHAYQIDPQIVAKAHSAKGLAHTIAQYQREHKIQGSILNPTSNISTAELVAALSVHNIEVKQLIAYTNQPLDYSKEELEQLFAQEFHWVSFCSSSAVSNFFNLLEQKGITPPSHIKYAVIGPSTRRTLERYGYVASAQPIVPQMEELAIAMAIH